MSAVIVHWHETPALWCAYDADDFDGADDAAPFPVGWGRTQAEALADLAAERAEREVQP